MAALDLHKSRSRLRAFVTVLGDLGPPLSQRVLERVLDVRLSEHAIAPRRLRAAMALHDAPRSRLNFASSFWPLSTDRST